MLPVLRPETDPIQRDNGMGRRYAQITIISIHQSQIERISESLFSRRKRKERRERKRESKYSNS